MAAVGPQEDIGAREEALHVVRSEVCRSRLEAVHGRGHPDVHGGETGSRHCDDVQQAEVAEGRDQGHQQREGAPHHCPAPAQRGFGGQYLKGFSYCQDPCPASLWRHRIAICAHFRRHCVAKHPETSQVLSSVQYHQSVPKAAGQQ